MLIRYILKIFIYSISILIVSKITNFIYVKDFSTAILFAIVLGIINFFVRPIFVFFTLPITILTFGIFLIFINGFMLMLASAFFENIQVNGFISAAVASLLISLFVYLLSNWVFPKYL